MGGLNGHLTAVDDLNMAEPTPERRLEPRLLCADLMRLEWTEASGQSGTAWANLEDISASGACVQVDRAVPADAQVRIYCNNTELHGRVRYCVFRDTGYFIGVQFEGGSKWSRQDFRPKHLLDPRRLTRMSLRRLLSASLVH